MLEEQDPESLGWKAEREGSQAVGLHPRKGIPYRSFWPDEWSTAVTILAGLESGVRGGTVGVASP